MLLHTDVPTRAQVHRLLTARDPASVSIYVPADPSSRGDVERIELKNLTGEAVAQLERADIAKREVAELEEELADLVDDDSFWRHQARSLAIFATPTALTTFRLANRLGTLVEVSDRFHVKALLRAVTFPQTAFVLALAQGTVRVLEITPDREPEELAVPDMPRDVASAVGKASIKDRAPSGRLQGTEGQKVRIRQYARQVDHALRPVLHGVEAPLILAAAEPIDAIYRSVNSNPNLLETTIEGNPEATSDADLARLARERLDDLYAAQLRELHELYERRYAQGRGSTDVADVARAATYGLVDTALVDIDDVVPGRIDDETGAVAFDDRDDAANYGVVDEIARRVLANGGRVLAVRRSDVPGGGSVAAILRYAP